MGGRGGGAGGGGGGVEGLFEVTAADYRGIKEVQLHSGERVAAENIKPNRQFTSPDERRAVRIYTQGKEITVKFGYPSSTGFENGFDTTSKTMAAKAANAFLSKNRITMSDGKKTYTIEGQKLQGPR